MCYTQERCAMSSAGGGVAERRRWLYSPSHSPLALVPLFYGPYCCTLPILLSATRLRTVDILRIITKPLCHLERSERSFLRDTRKVRRFFIIHTSVCRLRRTLGRAGRCKASNLKSSCHNLLNK